MALGGYLEKLFSLHTNFFAFKIAKSDSFRKIRLSYFSGNEFLVKMYKLFQIDTISKIMYI